MRVALAEDSVLLREGLARLLGEAGFEVVAQCDNADDLLLKVRSYDPDVAIVDIRLPPTHNDEGLQAALDIRSQHPSVSVLVLSQYVELGLALKLLADSAEGVGYLLKDRIGDVEEFVAAVRRTRGQSKPLRPQRVRGRPSSVRRRARRASAKRPTRSRSPRRRRRRSDFLRAASGRPDANGAMPTKTCTPRGSKRCSTLPTARSRVGARCTR